jgi:hypothetical protein
VIFNEKQIWPQVYCTVVSSILISVAAPDSGNQMVIVILKNLCVLRKDIFGV